MSRNKNGTKSGWKKRDAAYRKQQAERRRANNARRLFRLMAGWR